MTQQDNKDDEFKKASEQLTQELVQKEKDPDHVEWPEYLQFLPCSKWSRVTWEGLSACLCGACIHAGFGIYNTWGFLSGYFTSKFRVSNPDLLVQQTLYVYPITLLSITASMQLAAWVTHKIDHRIHLLIGTVVFCSAVYFASFQKTYAMFILFYSIQAGIGVGFIFFLPVICGWSFFPLIKPVIGGWVTGWASLASMYYVEIAILMLNPNREKPTIRVPHGKALDKYFAPDSPQVAGISNMLWWFSVIALCTMLFGIPWIRFNRRPPKPKVNPHWDEAQKYMNELTEEQLLELKNRKQRYGLESAKASSALTQNLLAKVEDSNMAIQLQEIEKAKQLISTQDTLILKKMTTKSVRGCKVSEQGITITSDWAWYNQQELIADKNFWMICTMLYLSMTYCFFIKMCSRLLGSTYITNDSILFKTALEGYFFSCVARQVAPLIMQQPNIGFRKTYMGVLIIQIILACTIMHTTKWPHLYQAWVISSLFCEGATFAIFTPFSAQVYGVTLQIPVNALWFIFHTAACLSAIVLNKWVVPQMGWQATFYVLAVMSACALIINQRVKHTYDSFMPFINLDHETPANPENQTEANQTSPNQVKTA